MKTLNANYDLSFYPARYSFIEWLLGMEMYRMANNYDKLLVKFTPGPINGFRNRDQNKLGIPPEKLQLIIDKVCRPFITIVGAEEGGDGSFGDTALPYTARYIVECHRKGQKIPEYHIPPEYAEKTNKYSGFMTITLREAIHYPERNSNISAWIKFANYMKERGENVIFIRDTEFADQPVSGAEDFPISPEASTDLFYRLALYRAAKMNWFVSNGPHTPCIYDPNINYMFFIKSAIGYDINTDKWWREHNGIGCGEQWPWATPLQKVIKQNDLFFNLREEYDKLKKINLPTNQTNVINNL